MTNNYTVAPKERNKLFNDNQKWLEKSCEDIFALISKGLDLLFRTGDKFDVDEYNLLKTDLSINLRALK